ncbi:BMC domain-containing protein [Virgibacillus kimchii]
MTYMEALGLIENRSYLSSIVAADAALKAADVTLVDVEIIKGGYVTVQLIGDVAAVKAAVETGTDSVESFGTLISSHVIPRMHLETHQLIDKLPKQSEQLSESTEKKEEEKETGSAPEALEAADIQAADDKVNETLLSEPEQTQKVPKLYRKDLEKMTVGKLRQLVRERNAMADNTRNIKYARKAELISSLIDDEDLHDGDAKDK